MFYLHNGKKKKKVKKKKRRIGSATEYTSSKVSNFSSEKNSPMRTEKFTGDGR